MAKRIDTTPLEHHWCCEECGTCYTGVNPPDECTMCAHTYFENLFDLAKEADVQEPEYAA